MSIYKKFSILVSSLIFILLCMLYYTNNISIIDETAYRIITSIKSNTVTSLFKVITMCGGFLFSLILSNIVLLFNKKKGIYFFVNVFIILGINTFFKYIFLRPRPEKINLITETGYSFPSAHSMLTIGLYGLLLYFVIRTIHHNKKRKIISTCIICLLMVLIPITRVYLGVHYFSDVLAGACLSCIWLMIYSSYLEKKNII